MCRGMLVRGVVFSKKNLLIRAEPEATGTGGASGCEVVGTVDRYVGSAVLDIIIYT